MIGVKPMWKRVILFILMLLSSANAAPDPQLAEYEQKLAAWKRAQEEYKPRADEYWSRMAATRALSEYLREHPPVYAGPSKPVHPYYEPQTSTIPRIGVFLAAAREQYGFVPEQSAEIEFKKTYAREALAVGLTKEQVVGVYAFETGGNGKHDLQPMGKNAPISTALGYAQLLNANSVQMLNRHGYRFAEELAAAGKESKAAIVRRMTHDARSVYHGWDALQSYAKLPRGRAMHALNLDVDIGPKMQMQKLKDIVVEAEFGGHPVLGAAQLELLNLAGERNGLLMLRPELTQMPTANFFARDGYEANPVVHQRTAEGLLTRIDELMGRWILRPGAQELVDAFRHVQQE